MNELTKYVITSPKFQGTCTYRFDEGGMMYVIRFAGGMEPSYRRHFCQQIRLTVQELEEWIAAKNATGSNLVLVKQEGELTFDMMYQAYDVKKDRKRAEEVWVKLSKEEQLKAYLHITKYNNYLRLNRGISKQELKTYLRAQLWND